MKKFALLFLSLLFSSSLLSCNGNFNNNERKVSSIQLVKNEFTVSSTSTKLRIKVIYDDGKYVIVDVTDDMIKGEVDYSKAGTYEIEITYKDIKENFDITVIGYETITLDCNDNIDGINQYSTGNYVSYREDSVTFQFYRATRNLSTTLASIFPKDTYVKVDSLAGAIYNKTPIDGIVSIDIEYKSNDGLKLLSGKNRDKMIETTLPEASSLNTVSIDVDSANFFSIETISNTAVINSININYTGIDNGGVEAYERANEEKYRLNPVTYNDTLVPGVSYVDVPIDVTVTGDSYTINQTKRYTYYTYDYVASNPSCKEDAIHIEPIDVANYFIAFKTYPVNYVYKKQYSAAYSLFFDDTRCVSDYNRTNGYATSVPYKAGSNGKPHYYECDIALTSAYTSSNRGVGRLVVWEYGFDHKGYDNSIVAVFTDDHYASFSEYLNNGTWGDRFNAEFSRTAYIYASAKTLN